MDKHPIHFADEAQLARLHWRRIGREGVLVLDVIERRLVATNRQRRFVLMMPEIEHELATAATLETSPPAPDPRAEQELAQPRESVDIGEPRLGHVDTKAPRQVADEFVDRRLATVDAVA